MGNRHGRNSKFDKSVYRSLVLISQFVINMLEPISMMSALGIWLDNRYGTSFWTVLLFFVGAIAGGQNVYRMAKTVYEAEERENGDAEENK